MGLDHGIVLSMKSDLEEDEIVLYGFEYRKVSFVQGFMEREINIDNGEQKDIPSETFLKFLQDLTEVKYREDDEVSLKKLPPTSGFFYGARDIDEYYYEDVSMVLDDMRKIQDAIKNKENKIFEEANNLNLEFKISYWCSY